MKKFLDLDGLTYFWNKAKNYISGMYGVRENSETVKAGDIRYLDGKENVGKILMYTQDGVTADTPPDFPYEENLNYVFPESGDLSYAPLGFPFPNPFPYIPDGCVPALGQESSVEMYPVFKYIQLRHPEMVITEEQWQQMATEQNGHVPYYSSGNGSTTFRFPCLLHYFCATSDGQKLGKYEADGLPNIEGSSTDNGITIDFGNGSGAFYSKQSTATFAVGQYRQAKLFFDASRSNPIYGASDSVRPKTAYGTWIIKAYGVIPTADEMTVQGIVQSVSNVEIKQRELETKIDSLDSINVVEIYPNGTKEEPANITTGQRIEVDNPFKGYYVYCRVELFIKGEWGEPNWVYSQSGWGTCASQILPSDKIIIQAGGSKFVTQSLHACNPWSLTRDEVGALTSAPYRLIVQKLGKIGGGE